LSVIASSLGDMIGSVGRGTLCLWYPCGVLADKSVVCADEGGGLPGRDSDPETASLPVSLSRCIFASRASSLHRVTSRDCILRAFSIGERIAFPTLPIDISLRALLLTFGFERGASEPEVATASVGFVWCIWLVLS
jgi:hypothetical protein